MTKNFLITVLLSVLLTACITTDRKPSICETISEPSVLCEIADKHGTTIEDMSAVLIVANAVAISSGAYEPKDALKVLRDIRAAISNPVSYLFFKSKVQRQLILNPALFEIADIYISEFTSPKVMYDFDRMMLIRWLDDRIRSMENMSASFGSLDGGF